MSKYYYIILNDKNDEVNYFTLLNNKIILQNNLYESSKFEDKDFAGEILKEYFKLNVNDGYTQIIKINRRVFGKHPRFVLKSKVLNVKQSVALRIKGSSFVYKGKEDVINNTNIDKIFFELRHDNEILTYYLNDKNEKILTGIVGECCYEGEPPIKEINIMKEKLKNNSNKKILYGIVTKRGSTSFYVEVPGILIYNN